jgi:hypothetical protein
MIIRIKPSRLVFGSITDRGNQGKVAGEGSGQNQERGTTSYVKLTQFYWLRKRKGTFLSHTRTITMT